MRHKNGHGCSLVAKVHEYGRAQLIKITCTAIVYLMTQSTKITVAMYTQLLFTAHLALIYIICIRSTRNVQILWILSCEWDILSSSRTRGNITLANRIAWRHITLLNLVLKENNNKNYFIIYGIFAFNQLLASCWETISTLVALASLKIFLSLSHQDWANNIALLLLKIIPRKEKQSLTSIHFSLYAARRLYSAKI